MRLVRRPQPSDAVGAPQLDRKTASAAERSQPARARFDPASNDTELGRRRSPVRDRLFAARPECAGVRFARPGCHSRNAALRHRGHEDVARSPRRKGRHHCCRARLLGPGGRGRPRTDAAGVSACSARFSSPTGERLRFVSSAPAVASGCARSWSTRRPIVRRLMSITQTRRCASDPPPPRRAT